MLGTRLPRHPGVLRFLFYFLCIGAGYILIEVALIQKFVLFLGHPTYALTVVIFSMLVSSGLGSYFSRRILANDDRRLFRTLGLIAVLVALLAAIVSPLLAAGVGLPLELKIRHHGGADCAGRASDGDAVPHRAAAPGKMAQAFGALGVVVERGSQRAGFGGGAGVCHLSGAGADAAGWADCFTW